MSAGNNPNDEEENTMVQARQIPNNSDEATIAGNISNEENAAIQAGGNSNVFDKLQSAGNAGERKNAENNSLQLNTNNLTDAVAGQNENKSFELNIINANARSLNNKVDSLIESFEEYDITFALLSETWFKNGKELE